MKRGSGYILLALCAMSFSIASCRSNGKVIPRGKLSEIYAEMYIADQWVVAIPQEKAKAETTWFYKPVLDSLGYTVADFENSERHYLKDPDEYAKILRKASRILKMHADVLRAQDRRERLLRTAPNHFDTDRPLYHLNVDHRAWFRHVDAGIDSTGNCYMDANDPDTTFAGPRLLIRQSGIQGTSLIDNPGKPGPVLGEALPLTLDGANEKPLEKPSRPGFTNFHRHLKDMGK